MRLVAAIPAVIAYNHFVNKVNVLTGGQFLAMSGATYSNALTISGYGWQEGALYGALRLQFGATYKSLLMWHRNSPLAKSEPRFIDSG